MFVFSFLCRFRAARPRPLRRSWSPNVVGPLDTFPALLPIILYPGFISSFPNESHLTHYIASAWLSHEYDVYRQKIPLLHAFN